MKCPVCGEMDTRVVDSRAVNDNTEIRRRRQCDRCAHRFTTYERAERSLPLVAKKDGRREPWNRDKIMHGLVKACEKRPISVEAMEAVADALCEEMSATGEAEIASRAIGERIMAKLHALDEVAYVRFASVYRQFKDIDEFMTELAEMMRDRGKQERERP
jgi:transcriptional repressor NrdR